MLITHSPKRRRNNFSIVMGKKKSPVYVYIQERDEYKDIVYSTGTKDQGTCFVMSFDHGFVKSMLLFYAVTVDVRLFFCISYGYKKLLFRFVILLNYR